MYLEVGDHSISDLEMVCNEDYEGIISIKKGETFKATLMQDHNTKYILAYICREDGMHNFIYHKTSKLAMSNDYKDFFHIIHHCERTHVNQHKTSMSPSWLLEHLRKILETQKDA